MNRVLFSTLLLLGACSSKSESTAPTTPTSDSTVIENSEPASASVPTEASGDSEPAEPGSYRNLQVLPNTISEAQLKATMNQVSSSLGVQCDFCHVDENMASDDNPHKVAARGMMTMTMELNKEFFGGEMVVNCMTCHKGKEHPAP